MDRLAAQQALEDRILALLRARRGKTVCPSEVARSAGGADWPQLMAPVREAAWRLEAAGRVAITQGGRRVGRGSARGPIRIGPAPGDGGETSG